MIKFHDYFDVSLGDKTLWDFIDKELCCYLRFEIPDTKKEKPFYRIAFGLIIGNDKYNTNDEIVKALQFMGKYIDDNYKPVQYRNITAISLKLKDKEFIKFNYKDVKIGYDEISCGNWDNHYPGVGKFPVHVKCFIEFVEPVVID